MKVKQLALNVVVMAGSLVVALVLAELGAHLVLDPSNYLAVTTVPDDVLGMTLPTGVPGFDAWGFRNPAVPSAADVVALGDSHTFGNTATMADAWPSVVARATGLTVYNMGMGGYGPDQYHQLFQTRALTLHPTWVICGLYMGDDFENAYSITYGLDHWAFLRSEDAPRADFNIWDTPTDPAWYKGITNWLSAHSILYRLVVHGPVLGGVKNALQFRQVIENEDPQATALVVADKGIREAFRPTGMATRLDQSSAPIVEGMRITFRLLDDMNRKCHERGCRLLVAVIPTKETVFSDYLDGNTEIHLHDAIQETISNERLARTKLFAFLDGAGIPYVDALPGLKAAVEHHLYAPMTTDMHPGKNGYRVIGEQVAAFLKSHPQS